MRQASLIKWEKGGLKTPLARARGLGSGQGALHHWMVQRITGVLSVPLALWLCWAVLGLIGLTHAEALTWLANPVNAVLMILAVLTFAYHAALGMQVVVEDYVHSEGCKLAALVFVKAALIVLSAVCVFAVLKVAL